MYERLIFLSDMYERLLLYRLVTKIGIHCKQCIPYDRETSKVCEEIICKRTFSGITNMSLKKAMFAMDLLEIDLRRLCKSEDILYPSYYIIADYRKEIALVKEI